MALSPLSAIDYIQYRRFDICRATPFRARIRMKSADGAVRAEECDFTSLTRPGLRLADRRRHDARKRRQRDHAD